MDACCEPLDLSSKKPAELHHNGFTINNILTGKYNPSSNTPGSSSLHSSNNPCNNYQCYFSKFNFIRNNLWKQTMYKRALRHYSSVNKFFHPVFPQHHSLPNVPIQLPVFVKVATFENKNPKAKNIFKQKKNSFFLNNQQLNRDTSTAGNVNEDNTKVKTANLTRSSNQYNDHILLPSSDLQDPFECKLCHNDFWSAYALASHDCCKMKKLLFRWALKDTKRCMNMRKPTIYFLLWCFPN